MHWCNTVDRGMTVGAGPDCLARRLLLVRVMTSTAFCIVRILPIKLLGNARAHFVAAQTLLRLRLQRAFQTVGRDFLCHDSIEFMADRTMQSEVGHLAKLNFRVLVTTALRARFVGGSELVQARGMAFDALQPPQIRRV